MLLEQMLICLDLNDSNDYTFCIFISKCCMVLQKRENCSKLLQQYRIIRPVSMTREKHINTIFTLFGIFYNDFKSELQEMLNKYSKYNLRHREAVEILINENVHIDTEKPLSVIGSFLWICE